MPQIPAALAIVVTTVLLNACGGSWWPIGRKDSAEPARIPAGATQYACASNKQLLVRYTADGKSAWVIYPEREFRLDRVASSSGERYTNGVSTLTTQGEETTLEESGMRLFTDCKRVQRE